jgi:RNA polymerase sigma factor (sigma-70 family)
MSSPGSITLLTAQLRSSDPIIRNAAAEQIWQRHFPNLLALVCQHLDERVRRREDEQDILQTMYASFCVRMQRGDFSLGSREDLWLLLVTITLNKTRKAAARQRRHCRDYRREVADAGVAEDASPNEALAQMEDDAPTPADAAELTEELQRRLTVLPQPLQQIALWKFEGYTNEEIAGRLGCTVRTVERKLQLIREQWQSDEE